MRSLRILPPCMNITVLDSDCGARETDAVGDRATMRSQCRHARAAAANVCGTPQWPRTAQSEGIVAERENRRRMNGRGAFGNQTKCPSCLEPSISELQTDLYSSLALDPLAAVGTVWKPHRKYEPPRLNDDVGMRFDQNKIPEP